MALHVAQHDAPAVHTNWPCDWFSPRAEGLWARGPLERIRNSSAIKQRIAVNDVQNFGTNIKS